MVPTFVFMVFWFTRFVQKQTIDDDHEVACDISTAAAAAVSHACDVTATVSRSDVIQKVEGNEGRAGEMCVGHGKQDHVIIFTTRLFARLCTWRHMYCFQHQELNHLWSRDDTCTGFNIKNSLTCDLYNYNPAITIAVADCTLYQVTDCLNLPSFPCYWLTSAGNCSIGVPWCCFWMVATR